MITALWSAKGGSGVTAATVGFAASCAQIGPVVVVDLAGDIPIATGLALAPEQQGVADWLAAGAYISHDALSALRVPIAQ